METSSLTVYHLRRCGIAVARPSVLISSSATTRGAPSLRLRSGQALAFFARAMLPMGFCFEFARRFCRPYGTHSISLGLTQD